MPITTEQVERLPGRSIIGDDFPIRNEPHGLFGRFFLRVDQLFEDADWAIRIISPQEIVRINEVNSDSWKPVIANLDHRIFPVTGGDAEMLSIAAYDGNGRALATSSVRRFDVTGSNVHDECTSLRMFFGPQTEVASKTISFELSAPSAPRLTGIIHYHGAVWVHPDLRHNRITRLLPKLNRYMVLAQDYSDYTIAFASAHIMKPHVLDSYSAEALEPAHAYKVNGETLYGGVMAWMSRDFLLKTLETDVAKFEAAASISDL